MLKRIVAIELSPNSVNYKKSNLNQENNLMELGREKEKKKILMENKIIGKRLLSQLYQNYFKVILILL